MAPALSFKPRFFMGAQLRWGMRLIGAVFVLAGAMALLFGVGMLLNPKLLGGAAVSAWSALCGQPAGRPSTSMLLMGIGAGVALVGTGLVTVTSARHGIALIWSMVIVLTGSGAGYTIGRLTLAADAPPPSGKFALLNPPRPMPNFILRNTRGGMTELRDFEGEAVVLFFGYTHCPDVCPTTLSDYRRVKRELGADASQVHFVFISVDGERDTPDYLAKYIGAFDPDFVALVAHPSVVRSILRDYGGDFRTGPIPGTDSYKVLHTADSYLLDAQGRWRALLPLGTPTDEVVRQIQRALN